MVEKGKAYFFSLARYPTSPHRATELNMWPWYSAFALVSPQLDSSSARRWGFLVGKTATQQKRGEHPTLSPLLGSHFRFLFGTQDFTPRYQS